MTRILVYGASGMLGHKLCQVLSEQFEVWGTVRHRRPELDWSAVLPQVNLIEDVDVYDLPSVADAARRVRPDVIINAIGIVKQLDAAHDSIASIMVNSLFPHRLAEVGQELGARLIHVSTDCVFSGRKGFYSEDDIPDPVDLYGRTKHLGEVAGEHVLTVRTSIIGRELTGSHGLVEWFLSNRGKRVRGFSRAVFSGLPTIVLARAFGHIIEAAPTLHGVYHVAASPIDKYRLLCLVRDAYSLDVEIEPSDELVIDRSLNGSRFCDATGFVPESWERLVEQMAADTTPYDLIRGG